MRKHVIAIWMMVFLGMAGMAGVVRGQFVPAGPGGLVGSEEHVRAELIAEEDAAVPGGTVTLGLVLNHDEHWHTYWVNPGTGYPTNVKWDTNHGIEVGAIEWPTPMRFVSPGEVAAALGYTGRVVLLMEAKIPADLKGETVVISGQADWLECDPNMCVPGGQRVEVELPVRGTAGVNEANAEIFARARAALPVKEPGGLVGLKDEGGGRYLMTVAGETEDLKDAYFMTYAIGVLDEVAKQPMEKVEGGFTLELTRARGQTKPIKALAGVVRLERMDGSVAGLAVDVLVGSEAQLIGIVELLGYLGGALLGGMILNLMPCVFPVLAIKILGFVKQAGEDRRKVLNHGLVFGTGVLMSFWALAGVLVAVRAAGTGVGWGFQLTDPIFVGLMTMLVFVIGLNLAGVFDVGFGVMNVAGGVSEKVDRSSYAGSFFNGVLATALATPCSAPFMGAAVGAAFALPNMYTVAILTALGVGMAIPYVVLSAFPGWLRILPRPGRWMETFKQLMAFPMFVVAVWLGGIVFLKLTDALWLFLLLMGLVLVGLGCWVWGRWRGIGAKVVAVLCVGLAVWMVVKGPGKSRIAWEPFDATVLQQRLADGQVVFVDFTADWCLTCKTYEALAIESQAVEEAIKKYDVVAMKADWTNRGPEIGRELAKFGRAAVPFYVFYSPKAGTEPITTDVLLRPSDVVRRIEQAAGENDMHKEEG